MPMDRKEIGVIVMLFVIEQKRKMMGKATTRYDDTGMPERFIVMRSAGRIGPSSTASPGPISSLPAKSWRSI